MQKFGTPMVKGEEEDINMNLISNKSSRDIEMAA